jgi:plasmid stabilization system protein ParE
VVVRFADEAGVEVLAAARRYRLKADRKTAQRFLAEVDRAVKRIAESPERWPVHLHGTRRVLLGRFPFALIYRVTETEVVVMAVAHHKQRPGYWGSRLP